MPGLFTLSYIIAYYERLTNEKAIKNVNTYKQYQQNADRLR